IVANYPAVDPQQTWPSWLPRPPAPAGWQTVGTHDEFGLSVDSGWYDDFFGGDDMLDDATVQALQQFLGDYSNPDWGLRRSFYGCTDAAGVWHPGLFAQTGDLEQREAAEQGAIAALAAKPPVDPQALAAALAPLLQAAVSPASFDETKLINDLAS